MVRRSKCLSQRDKVKIRLGLFSSTQDGVRRNHHGNTTRLESGRPRGRFLICRHVCKHTRTHASTLETGFHYVPQDGFKLKILLPQSPECTCCHLNPKGVQC